MKQGLKYIIIALIAVLFIIIGNSVFGGSDTIDIKVQKLEARIIYLENAVKALQENPRVEKLEKRLGDK